MIIIIIIIILLTIISNERPSSHSKVWLPVHHVTSCSRHYRI